MQRGIDISRYQGKINWDKIKTDFVFIKATQGVAWVDPMFEINRAEAGRKKIPCGFYHYTNVGEFKTEADHFLETVGEIKEGEMIALDFEVKHANPSYYCKRFLDYVYKKTSKKPYLYTYENRILTMDWKECTDYPLWVAKYNINDGQMGTPPKTGAWNKYTIWQYTSRGSMPGIEGNVDLNYAPTTLLDAPQAPPSPVTPESGFKHGQFIKLSQRDPKWSFKTIGNSTSTIGAYGCTITCISMASSWFDCFKDPAWMAKNLRFQNDLVIWQSIDEKTCFDFEWRFYKYDEPRMEPSAAARRPRRSGPARKSSSTRSSRRCRVT